MQRAGRQVGAIVQGLSSSWCGCACNLGEHTEPRSRGISKPAYPLPELIILQRDVPQAFWIGENTPRYPAQNFVAFGSRGRHPPSPVGDEPNDLAA